VKACDKASELSEQVLVINAVKSPALAGVSQQIAPLIGKKQLFYLR
jgi:ketopantoate reductase